MGGTLFGTLSQIFSIFYFDASPKSCFYEKLLYFCIKLCMSGIIQISLIFPPYPAISGKTYDRVGNFGKEKLFNYFFIPPHGPGLFHTGISEYFITSKTRQLRCFRNHESVSEQVSNKGLIQGQRWKRI